MLYFVGYVAVFFFSAITRGVVNHTHGASLFASFLWIAVGVLSVYFLDWIALIFFVMGSFSAGFVKIPNENQQ